MRLADKLLNVVGETLINQLSLISHLTHLSVQQDLNQGRRNAALLNLFDLHPFCRGIPFLWGQDVFEGLDTIRKYWGGVAGVKEVVIPRK